MSASSSWQTRSTGALIEAIQTARRISGRVPFPHREIFPGAGADLERHIRRNQFGLGHAACSNPIGASGDRMAVLDGKLRVRGTRNVRVVDASSFPRIPGSCPGLRSRSSPRRPARTC